MVTRNIGNQLSGPIRLSIAAPAYNESDGIRAVVQHWHKFLKQSSDIAQFEIVICNDGSKDQTRYFLDELAKQFPEVRPVHFPSNQGAAAALCAAIRATQLDWVLLLDSDDQFPIENLSVMLAQLRVAQSSAILGTRDKNDNFFARMGSKLSGIICNLVHGSNIKDFNSACKLVSGPILRSLVLEAKGMNYSTEITSRLLECGVPIIEVDIDHRRRVTGKSSMKLIKGSVHRCLFVFYIALRQLLLRTNILRRTQV